MAPLPLLRFLSLWTPVAAYMAMIFFVSAVPSAPLPQQVSDKVAHMTAYAVLAVLSVRAVSGGLSRRVTRLVALLAFVITSGYGAFDELHQMFVPGRMADIVDWFADTAGAVVGLSACWAWGIIPRSKA